MKQRAMNTASRKRNLSLFLAIVMVFGVCSPAAIAAGNEAPVPTNGSEGGEPIAVRSGYDALASNHAELVAAIGAAPMVAHPNPLHPEWVIAITQSFTLEDAIEITGLRNVHLLSYGTDPDTGEGPDQFTLTAAPERRHFEIGSPFEAVPRTAFTLSNIILDGGRPGDSAFWSSHVTLRSNAVIQHSRWSIGGGINGGFVFLRGTSEVRYNEATNRCGGA